MFVYELFMNVGNIGHSGLFGTDYLHRVNTSVCWAVEKVRLGVLYIQHGAIHEYVQCIDNSFMRG